MFLALIFLATHAMAAPDEMEKIDQRLLKCSEDSGYPKVKACSAQAKRDALALVEQVEQKFVEGLKTASAKKPRLLEAARELAEAQRNWQPYHVAHCRYQMEFNDIEAVDLAWRMDNCQYVEAKKRFNEIINVYMK